MDTDALIREYGGRVYNLAYRITGNRQDAEDVAQQTFLQVHRSLHRFRGDSSVYTWIYRIALNAGLRARGRLDSRFFESLDEAVHAYADDLPDDVDRWRRDPESRYIYDELLAEIQRACVHFVTRRLTDEQRAVYVLRAMLGFPLDDISQILDVSKNTVKARLHRAKASLKSYFSGRCQWAAESGDCTCESKLGFAIAAAPEILQKLRNHPPDSKLKEVMRTTLRDVADEDDVRRFFPDEPMEAEALQRLLSE